MNVLDLIRSKTLKKEHLHEAQVQMAKAYRGLPYVDSHHDEPASQEHAKQVFHLTSISRNGDVGASAQRLNVLDLIRRKILKKEHLNDAQFIMAKAYRGVPYAHSHHAKPTSEEKSIQLTYRGQSYEH
jgi:hypothetical protein